MSLAMWKLTMLTEAELNEKLEKKTESLMSSPFDNKLKEQIKNLIVKAKAIQSM